MVAKERGLFVRVATHTELCYTQLIHSCIQLLVSVCATLHFFISKGTLHNLQAEEQ